MQWFVVKYRKPDGAMAEAEFEAADKSALFKILAEKKISAISVRPGSLGRRVHKSVASAPAKYGYLFYAIIISVFLFVVAIVCAWFMSNRVSEPDTKVSRVRRSKPATIQVAPAKVADVVVDEKQLRKEKIKRMVAARGGVQNLTDEDKREILEAVDGPRKVQQPVGAPLHGNPYVTATDQVIAMAISAGDNVPPLPGIEADMEKDMLVALQKPIVVNDDDSDEVKRMKELVSAARAEIQERLKQGESMTSILESHREDVNGSTQLRTDVQKGARELMESGDIEGMELYLKKANEMLAEMGVPPVERPLTREEQIEKLREKKENRR